MLSTSATTLVFRKDPDRQIFAAESILSNLSAHYVAYKIQSKAPKLFLVQPSCGVVSPGDNVLISFQHKTPSSHDAERDRFLVCSTELAEDEMSQSPADVFAARGRNVNQLMLASRIEIEPEKSGSALLDRLSAEERCVLDALLSGKKIRSVRKSPKATPIPTVNASLELEPPEKNSEQPKRRVRRRPSPQRTTKSKDASSPLPEEKSAAEGKKDCVREGWLHSGLLPLDREIHGELPVRKCWCTVKDSGVVLTASTMNGQPFFEMNLKDVKLLMGWPRKVPQERRVTPHAWHAIWSSPADAAVVFCGETYLEVSEWYMLVKVVQQNMPGWKEASFSSVDKPDPQPVERIPPPVEQRMDVPNNNKKTLEDTGALEREDVLHTPRQEEKEEEEDSPSSTRAAIAELSGTLDALRMRIRDVGLLKGEIYTPSRKEPLSLQDRLEQLESQQETITAELASPETSPLSLAGASVEKSVLMPAPVPRKELYKLNSSCKSLKVLLATLKIDARREIKAAFSDCSLLLRGWCAATTTMIRPSSRGPAPPPPKKAKPPTLEAKKTEEKPVRPRISVNVDNASRHPRSARFKRPSPVNQRSVSAPRQRPKSTRGQSSDLVAVPTPRVTPPLAGEKAVAAVRPWVMCQLISPLTRGLALEATLLGTPQALDFDSPLEQVDAAAIRWTDGGMKQYEFDDVCSELSPSTFSPLCKAVARGGTAACFFLGAASQWGKAGLDCPNIPVVEAVTQMLEELQTREEPVKLMVTAVELGISGDRLAWGTGGKNVITDLLKCGQSTTGSVTLRRDSSGAVRLSNAVTVCIRSQSEFEKLLEVVESRRSFTASHGATVKDRRRSTSGPTVPVGHVVLVVESTVGGKCAFVDLCNPVSQHPHAKLLAHGLSALSDVFTALAAGSVHVPYRHSKLTAVLRDVLCSTSKLLMVGTLNCRKLESRSAHDREKTGRRESLSKVIEYVSTIRSRLVDAGVALFNTQRKEEAEETEEEAGEEEDRWTPPAEEAPRTVEKKTAETQLFQTPQRAVSDPVLFPPSSTFSVLSTAQPTPKKLMKGHGTPAHSSARPVSTAVMAGGRGGSPSGRLEGGRPSPVMVTKNFPRMAEAATERDSVPIPRPRSCPASPSGRVDRPMKVSPPKEPRTADSPRNRGVRLRQAPRSLPRAVLRAVDTLQRR